MATLPGLDGRKMSKSYNNTIPLWLPEKELRKAILGIVTNSQAPGEPKNPDDSHIFSIYQAFASADETAQMRKAYADGIGWGDAKQKLFERIDSELAPMRERYEALIADPDVIEGVLRGGAERARHLSAPFLAKLREAVGLRPLTEAARSASETKAKSAKSRRCKPWCSATRTNHSRSRCSTRRRTCSSRVAVSPIRKRRRQRGRIGDGRAAGR